MSHPIHVDYNLRILMVESPAAATSQDIFDTIDILEKKAKDTGFNRVLLDLRKLTSLPHMAELFDVALNMPRNVWIAVLSNATGQLESAIEFVETVSKNRGHPLHLFDSEDDAIEWLQEL